MWHRHILNWTTKIYILKTHQQEKQIKLINYCGLKGCNLNLVFENIENKSKTLAHWSLHEEIWTNNVLNKFKRSLFSFLHNRLSTEQYIFCSNFRTWKHRYNFDRNILFKRLIIWKIKLMKKMTACCFVNWSSLHYLILNMMASI